MVDQNAYNAAIDNYLDQVDDRIRAADLDTYRGTATLDPVQEEIDNTIQSLEVNKNNMTISALRLEMNRSVKRVEATIHNLKQATGLGNVTQFSPTINEAWSDATKKAIAQIDSITSRYSKLLANMDPERRASYDQAFADVMNRGNDMLQRDPTSGAAKQYLNWVNTALKQLESDLSSLHQKSSQEMLRLTIQEKDAERLGVMSRLMVHANNLTAQQNKVVNTHNHQALAVLAAMMDDTSSYDAAIRQRKFDLVDKHLAVMRRILGGVEYNENLSGGFFGQSVNRNQLGRLVKGAQTPVAPVRKYTKQGRPPPTRRAGLFRDASDANGGGGLGNVGTSGTQLKVIDSPTANQKDLLATLSSNMAAAEAQGYITPRDELVLREQINYLNVNAFSHNRTQYNEAVKAYNNTLNRLKASYSGLGGIFSYDDWRKTANPLVRGFNTLAITGATLAVLGIGVAMMRMKKSTIITPQWKVSQGV